MADTDWEPLVPADTDQISTGAEDIRDLKDQIAAREANEHVAWAGAGVGGEHKEGSAMVYYAASDAVLVRPDGATSLSSVDQGRIRFNSDDQLISVYSGSEWVSAGHMVYNDGVTHVIDTPDPANDGLSLKTVGANSALKAETTGTGPAIKVAANSGGGNGIEIESAYHGVKITSNGGGPLLSLYSEEDGGYAILMRDLEGTAEALNAQADTSANMVTLAQEGSGSCVYAKINTSGATGSCFEAKLETASTGCGLKVTGLVDSSGIGIKLYMGGSNKPHIYMDPIVQTTHTAGYLWNDGTNLHYTNGTNNHIPISVGATGSNTEANGTVAVDIGGTTFYLLKAESA